MSPNPTQAVTLLRKDAERIERAVLTVERLAPPARPGQGPRTMALVSPGVEIVLGVTQAAFTSGSSVTVRICTATAAELSTTDRTAYLLPDKSSVDITAGTVAGAAVTGLSCSIASGAVVPLALGPDGDLYIINGTAKQQSVVDMQLGAAALQVKIAFDLGWGRSSASDWQNVETTVESKVIECETPGS